MTDILGIHSKLKTVDSDYLYRLYNHRWETQIRNIIDLGGLKENMCVLDAGCGWGRMIIGLKKYRPNIEITGVDLKENKFQAAEDFLKRQLGKNSFRFVKADICNLPFSDNQFDFVLCSKVIQYVPDIPGLVSELARVIKSGRNIVILSTNSWNFSIPKMKYREQTKTFSPKELLRIVTNIKGVTAIKTGTMCFVPGKYSRKTPLLFFERVLSSLPLLKQFGGISYIVINKD